MDQAEWTAERQIADMHLLTQMLMNQISQHAYDTQGNFEVIRDSNDARSSVSGDLSKANQVITDLNKDLNARDEATDQERQARNKERETLITEIQGLKVEVKTLEGARERYEQSFDRHKIANQKYRESYDELVRINKEAAEAHKRLTEENKRLVNQGAAHCAEAKRWAGTDNTRSMENEALRRVAQDFQEELFQSQGRLHDLEAQGMDFESQSQLTEDTINRLSQVEVELELGQTNIAGLKEQLKVAASKLAQLQAEKGLPVSSVVTSEALRERLRKSQSQTKLGQPKTVLHPEGEINEAKDKRDGPPPPPPPPPTGGGVPVH
jgi:myosin heavy subunit